MNTIRARLDKGGKVFIANREVVYAWPGERVVVFADTREPVTTIPLRGIHETPTTGES